MSGTRVPGETNDADELIAAGKTGMALKVEKGRIVQPVQSLQPGELHDPSRPASANVNLQPKMSYSEAMAEVEAGTLSRPVLTEEGWVMPNRSQLRGGRAA